MTLMDEIIINTPSEAFDHKDAIFNRVGHNQSSLLTILERAIGKQLVERRNLPHYTPQAYRLTDAGIRRKNALRPGD